MICVLRTVTDIQWVLDTRTMYDDDDEGQYVCMTEQFCPILLAAKEGIEMFLCVCTEMGRKFKHDLMAPPSASSKGMGPLSSGSSTGLLCYLSQELLKWTLRAGKVASFIHCCIPWHRAGTHYLFTEWKLFHSWLLKSKVNDHILFRLRLPFSSRTVSLPINSRPSTCRTGKLGGGGNRVSSSVTLGNKQSCLLVSTGGWDLFLVWGAVRAAE